MERGVFEIVDTESLVPAEHLLRKIDAAVDFNKIYDMVEPLYCADNGRPSVDPVVLFKMVLIQHLYGLGSLRRTAEEVSFNVAYRWFLGYRLQEDTPHFSTISYNFRHRFTSETVDQIFGWILMEMVEAGYVAPGVVFVDGTHIKANANTKKVVKKEVPVAAKRYAEELMEEVNADREAHGKGPFEDDTDDDNNNEPPAPPKKRRDNTSKKTMEERSRHCGSSNFTFMKMVSLWMNGLTAFSIKPLRLATFLGFFVAFSGFVFSMVIVVRKLIQPEIAAGYSSIMAALLFIGGVIMVLLGLIGEYIGRIYISLNNSPQYVIRDEVNFETEEREKDPT